MASAARLPIKGIALGAAVALTVGASKINIRRLLQTILTRPGSKLRIFAALVILVNLKNFPWVWHYRVWNAILKHLLFTLPRIPPHLAPSTLFLPVITSSHAPFSECDYNLHKSNSTYFSDLDVSRSHLVCALLQPGIKALSDNKANKLVLDPAGKPVLGRWSIMLGAVMCSFKREIGMYQGYEMWSRLLCWDRKWIYIVTHFVKKGTVKPSAYILTDGGWFGKGYKKVAGAAKGRDVDEKAIFATAISKYVVKLGRLTVHPEVTLNAAGMLPERPGGWATMAGPSGGSTPEALDAESELGEEPESDDWDWKRIVRENKRGLVRAENFAALDGLHEEFTGSQKPALGRYRDFLTT